MISRRLLMTTGVAAVVAAASPSAASADPVADAEAFVENQGNELLNILAMPAGNGRRDAFRVWVDGAFDLPLVGQLALGPYLQQATPEQLNAYLQAFNDYIVVTYEARFDSFSGYDLKILRGRPAGSKDSVVQTVVFLGDDSISVDFRVRHVNDSDLDVIDVTVEGLSMLKTQREEFSSVIQRSGLDGLIDGLRQRTNDIEAQAAG
jgi:phospholipid transport system substrate-binding protein